MNFVWNTLVRLFWRARFGKVNICGAYYCLCSYLPWRWGLRWKFGVVFWYWSPLDTSSGKWGQPFRRWCTKTIWRPVNYSAKYKWRWRCPRYCIGAGPRESRAHHPASLENWNSWLYCRDALFNWSVRLFTPTKNQCSMRESGKISKIRLLLPTQFAVSAPQEGALTTKMSKYFPKRSLFKIELSVENLLESNHKLSHRGKNQLFIQTIIRIWCNVNFVKKRP